MRFSAASEAFHASPADPLGAVVLCHGFTSTPQSMRAWAEHFLDAGFGVSLPLLSGHGTTWQEMAKTKWSHWARDIDHEVRDSARRHRNVAVCGLSMGGTLSLLMAQQHPQRVSALCLANPALGVPSRIAPLAKTLSKVVPSLSAIGSDIAQPGVSEECYERLPVASVAQLYDLTGKVKRDLHKVSQPIFLATSTADHVVPPKHSDWLVEESSSLEIERFTMERSYHVATLDYDAEELFRRSSDFLRGVFSDDSPADA
ncbi:alpha/beta hydrolase [Dermabacteraceae bacterium P13095]